MNESQIYIPLFYAPASFPNKDYFFQDKIAPAQGIIIKDVTAEQLDTVYKALNILTRQNVYFFQEK